MSQPSVCAVLLTADRSEMTRQAVECFKAQTYANKRLLVYDTGRKPLHDLDIGDSAWPEWYAQRGPERATIGELRNLAATFPMACNAEIIIHLDSDDYSHPSRISEQVALLQSSGADVVGFSDLLFWRERGNCDCNHAMIGRETHEQFCHSLAHPGEAWLYTSPGPKPSPPGTTLCYTREFWSRNPFPATSQGEELQFLSRAKVETVSSFPAVAPRGTMTTMEPRMIARIHPGAAGNTSTAYEPKKMLAESKRRNPAWRRTPEWDQYCQSVMARSAA